MTQIQEITHPEAVLPIELATDKYHPNNSDFMKQVRMSKNLIVSQSAACHPMHVMIVKGHFAGRTHAQVGLDNNRTPVTVAKTLKRPECQQLLLQLQHHAALWDGPSLNMRNRALSEIYIDNQADDPRTAIAAIAEMNKMAGVYNEKVDTNINIQINMVSKGALDG